MALVYENSFEEAPLGAPNGTKYHFVDLDGRIVKTSAKIATYRRIGVDGTGLQDTGSRGTPFQLVAVTYVEDEAAAEALLDVYYGLKVATAIKIVQRDNDWGIYHIIAVELAEPVTRVAAVCGLPDPPFGDPPTGFNVRLSTLWQLVARP